MEGDSHSTVHVPDIHRQAPRAPRVGGRVRAVVLVEGVVVRFGGDCVAIALERGDGILVRQSELRPMGADPVHTVVDTSPFVIAKQIPLFSYPRGPVVMSIVPLSFGPVFVDFPPLASIDAAGLRASHFRGAKRFQRFACGLQ